jgi:hypothetical protein
MDWIKKKIKNKFIFYLFLVLIFGFLLISFLTIYSDYPLYLKKSNFVFPFPEELIISEKKIKVEIASTPEAHYRGLSNREQLCPDCGMFFIFPDKQIRSFVMREMNFPLDIVFINSGEIVKIAADARPESYPAVAYSSSEPVDAVLELNAGYCSEKNIKIGDKILNFDDFIPIK